MKRLALILSILITNVAFAAPQHLVDKDTITRIPIEFRDKDDGLLISGGITSPDCECTKWDDGSNPSAPSDCTNEFTEWSTIGAGYLQLTAAELDSDNAYVYCKATNTDLVPVAIAVRTKVDLGPLTDADGTAQAGATTTITLAAGASYNDDDLEDALIAILSGTGKGQTRQITLYNDTTKVATVSKAWNTNPDATSQYRLIADVEQTVGGVATDWSSGELEMIRSALGITGTKTTATGGQLQTLQSGVTTVDGKVDTIDTNVDAILVDTGTAGVIVATNNDKTGYALTGAQVTAIADAIDDAVIEAEGSITRQQMESIILAVLAGETVAGKFKTPNGNADRVDYTIGTANDRTTVTLSPSS